MSGDGTSANVQEIIKDALDKALHASERSCAQPYFVLTVYITTHLAWAVMVRFCNSSGQEAGNLIG